MPELVILSSSPPMPSPGSMIRYQQRRGHTADVSSPARALGLGVGGILVGIREGSVGLASPGRIAGGIRGFTSASELLKNVPLAQREPESGFVESGKAGRDDLPVLRQRSDDLAEGSTASAGKPKTTKKKAAAVGTAAVKKPRKKKEVAGEGEGKRARIQGLGKVTKPTTAGTDSKRKAIDVPEEFTINGMNALHSNEDTVTSTFFKEPAVKRRLDWTPLKEIVSGATFDQSAATPVAAGEGEFDEELLGPNGLRFKDLVGSFGYEGALDPTTVPVRLPPTEVKKKRLRVKIVKPVVQKTTVEAATAVASDVEGVLIDLVPQVTVGREEPPKIIVARKRATPKARKEKVAKEKVPKVVKEKVVKEKIPKEKVPRKKPKTITEQATTPYAAGYSPTVAPLLQYLTVQPTAESQGRENGDGLPILRPGPTLKKLQKTRLLEINNGTAKLKTTSRKKKLPEPELSTLLSPLSAFKKLENQEVMFGTSSQLVRSSPSPEELYGQTAEMFVGTPDSLTDLALDQPKVIKSYTPATRGLWGAASRDHDGSLMEVDVIDLVNTPRVCKVRKKMVKVPASQSQKDRVASNAPSEPLDEHPMNVDEEIPAIPNPMLDLQRDSAYASVSASTDEMEQTEQTAPRASQSQSVGRPAASGMAVAASGVSTHGCPPKPAETAGPGIQKPDFAGYTTAQLSSQLVKYGFKPIKNRNQMIALLEKCCEGKNRAALQQLHTSVNVPVSGASNSFEAGPVEKNTADVGLPTNAKNTTAEAATVSAVKKPRGRPKLVKDSSTANPAVDESVTKKPRGRPKKPVSTDAQTVPSETVAQILPTASRIASPKKSRPRPTKDSAPLEIVERPAGTKIDEAGSSNKISQQKASSKASRKRSIDEVADSDAESNDLLAPGPKTPKREAADQSGLTPTTTAVLTSTEETPASAFLSDEERQERRFEYISRAVRAQARSSSAGSKSEAVRKPSFREKILMYDPIVLEDLAMWLNTEGLAQVGYDGEVGAAEVRLWCERHSVCCLWKESLRGGTRMRY